MKGLWYVHMRFVDLRNFVERLCCLPSYSANCTLSTLNLAHCWCRFGAILTLILTMIAKTPALKRQRSSVRFVEAVSREVSVP